MKITKCGALKGIYKLLGQTRGRGGLAKCQRKIVNEGGRGSKVIKISSTKFMNAPSFLKYFKKYSQNFPKMTSNSPNKIPRIGNNTLSSQKYLSPPDTYNTIVVV